MSIDDDDDDYYYYYYYMKTLFITFNIIGWNLYYELYNVLDDKIHMDCFEHFRFSIMNSFDADNDQYITTSQISYLLYLNNISNKDILHYHGIVVNWSVYQRKRGKNKGNSEEEMIYIFMNVMNKFNESGSIEQMNNDDMSAFS